MENKTIMTDLYELTMAQAYFDEEKQNEISYFDLFFRKNPFDGGYTISAGLSEIIEYIENFRFEEEEIIYLKSLNKFSDSFLKYLKHLRFTGDIFAIPDGTPVFPSEPILTVKANIIEAQIIETALLANFNHAALVATAAKRVVTAAGSDRCVMEFGARRARGVDSAIEASKYAYIGGCIGTSNTYAGMKYGIPVIGTMAHSLITEHESEYEAFLGYAKSNPDNCTFLVDTYDTLKSGVPNAIRVAKEYLIPNGYKLNGIRIDSGDLAYLSKESRKQLIKAGLEDVKICLSNELNEFTITSLIEQGAEFDLLGVGDNIAAARERLGGVYKLVAVNKDGVVEPRLKISNDTIKSTDPGYKKVYRFYDKITKYALGDVVVLEDEIIPKDEYTLIHPIDNWKKTLIQNYDVRELQVPIFLKGKLVYNAPTICKTREYCSKEFETIYDEVKRLYNPHKYYVDLSVELLTLKKKLIESYIN